MINFILVNYSNFANFGDQLSPFITEKLSGKKAVQYNKRGLVKIFRGLGLKNYMVTGSILQRADINTVVYGVGFMYSNNKLECKPKDVYSVRGKLSAKILENQGIKDPYCYGDPCLLMPLIYDNKVKTKYELGIIPHYVDKDNVNLNKFRRLDNVKFIDVDTWEIKKFIDQVRECKFIVSSSLHGLVCADAYNIPSCWLYVSDKVLGSGFKFYDYGSGIDKEINPLILRQDTSYNDLLRSVSKQKINFDIEKYINHCPFFE